MNTDSHKAYSPVAVFLLCALLLQTPAQARNIDLSTVPTRATVQLTIYNAEDLTLVRETRRISFSKGVNPLQFSWSNTLIDPTSVELRFLDHPGQLEILETSFPHDKPQMLYWNVQSEVDGEAQVEITYFTSGISWGADYTAIADAAETTLHLESFVRVYNNSGEEYESAQVRLVVGTINLVEKIAQLAQITPSQVGLMAKPKMERYKRQAAKAAMMDESAAMAPAPASAGFGDMEEAKEVAKESLSEYFIYTIEGTETIQNGWSKRLRSFETEQVPFTIQYRYRPREYGEQLVRLYLLRNDEESKLGGTPLPEGEIRVFRGNGRGGLSYLARQHLKYVPIGDKIELNLGEDPEVVFELVKLKVFRDELWMRVHGPTAYRKLGGGFKFDDNSSVAGWNEHAVYSQRIRNYSAKPIDVEIRRAYSGDVVFQSELEPLLHDYRTVQFSGSVAAGQKKDFYHEIIQREGHNRKKDNVELKTAEISF